MFKKTIYRKCEKFLPIKNAFVLSPGIGWGKNLITLATFKPKKIVAFDLFEFKEEQDFLRDLLKEKFDLEVEFYKGDFESLPEKYRNSFDGVITKAVLEHVKDLPKFLEDMNKFLKKGGIFYGSFGPIWYGAGGDHVGWGEKGLFYHLLADQEEYERNLFSLKA